MRHKLKASHAVTAAVNAAAILALVILTCAGKNIAGTQKYNAAAERWSSAGDHAQVSCFFASDAQFGESSAKALHMRIFYALNSIGVRSDSFPDAWSGSAGTAELRSGRFGTNAEVLAVGGNFFLFHEFELLSGSFFLESDLMHDTCVIDRDAAWRLFGSENITGQEITLDGEPFRVMGVISAPDSRYERHCREDVPLVFISYRSGYFEKRGQPRPVSCYECVLPEPFGKFAYDTVSNIIDAEYSGKASVVDNTHRFDPVTRAKAFGSLSDYAVRSDGIVLPFWENASRMADYDLTVIYFSRHVISAVPLGTSLYITIRSLHLLRKRLKKRFAKKPRAFDANAPEDAVPGTDDMSM